MVYTISIIKKTITKFLLAAIKLLTNSGNPSRNPLQRSYILPHLMNDRHLRGDNYSMRKASGSFFIKAKKVLTIIERNYSKT
jgi:hypothetical protein